ncbi:MAG: DsbA family protein [Planctomycetota bacterium]
MSASRSKSVAVALLVAALVVSGYLLARGFALSGDAAAGGDVCSTVFKKSCDATLTDPLSKQLGIPLAGWGIVYFVALLLSLLVVKDRMAVRALAAAGGLVSVALLGALLFGDVPLCPLCLVVNGLNLVALVPVWRGAPDGRPPALYLGMFAASGAQAKAVATEALKKYQSAPVQDIPVLPGDPVLGPNDARARMIVFSDALCPHCKRFWAMLKGVANGFGDDVQIVFKHFPLDSTCNRSVQETLHKHACTAARALEAARNQDAFWRYDEELKAPAKPGRKKTFGNVAADVGLDTKRFAADLKGDAVMARIKRDIELGIGLKLTATPAVFVNGRRVRPPSKEALEQVLDHVTGR